MLRIFLVSNLKGDLNFDVTYVKLVSSPGKRLDMRDDVMISESVYLDCLDGSRIVGKLLTTIIILYSRYL